MKEPITQKDMRFGDLIRWESDTSETAREFRITDPNSRPSEAGSYYLLDRPKPAPDLPTKPTLGWLTSKYGGSVLGTWEPQRLTGGPGVSVTRSGMRALLPEITGFTRAVAVPAVALDDLRSGVINDFDAAVRLIADFLAAVDKANGGDQS